MALTNDRLDIGRVINRTFGAIGGNFVIFLMLAGLLSGVPAAATIYGAGWFGQMLYGSGDRSSTSLALVGFSLLAGLINLISNYVLVGAITHGSVVFYNGRKAGVGECLSTGLRYAVPLVGVAIVTSIGVMLGMILLIVPGIFLALMWAVAAPAVVVEGGGVFRPMKRSGELTRNHRWAILGLVVIYLVISLIIQGVLAVAFGSMDAAMAESLYFGNAPLGAVAGSALRAVLGSVISSAGAAALYFELRTAKEGVSTEELAKVFA